jgi:hypothetical protein
MRAMVATAFLILSGAGPVLAEEVPRFAIEATCRGVATRGLDEKDSVKACIDDENTALGQLRAQWTTFTPANQRECIGETEIGGLPSYVEVLTCLQMYRDNQVTTTLKSRRPKKP